MPEVVANELLLKDPDEKRFYSLDFSALMASDETISTISEFSSLVIGGETSDLTLTSSAISGQTVTFWVASGTNAKTYRIKVKITTSAGQILVGYGTLKVTNR